MCGFSKDINKAYSSYQMAFGQNTPGGRNCNAPRGAVYPLPFQNLFVKFNSEIAFVNPENFCANIIYSL
jgi:hypothetical protein